VPERQCLGKLVEMLIHSEPVCNTDLL